MAKMIVIEKEKLIKKIKHDFEENMLKVEGVFYPDDWVRKSIESIEDDENNPDAGCEDEWNRYYYDTRL